MSHWSDQGGFKIKCFHVNYKSQKMTDAVPNLARLRFTAQFKHYCSSAFNCQRVLKWRTDVESAISMQGIAIAGQRRGI